MFEYVTIGVDDLATSRAFYDLVLSPLGGKVVLESPTKVFYRRPGGTLMAIGIPYDGQPCSFGNGSMFSLPAPSQSIVDEVYATAIRAGAQDEGAPGFRTPAMYIAYFRDPVGNKLAVYHTPSWEVFIDDAQKIIRERLENPS